MAQGQSCARCGKVERIPTHQLVKFDGAIHDLCADCYVGFRRWFFAGERILTIPIEPAMPSVPPSPRVRWPDTGVA